MTAAAVNREAGKAMASDWCGRSVLLRHEVAVRREALEIEGGARPPRQAVAAAWWELSAA
jgi:hypothetical protein